MGFEQLAELKKQLAKQARDVKQAQREAEAERAKPSTGRRGGTEGRPTEGRAAEGRSAERRPADGRPEGRRREDRPAAQQAEGKIGGAPGNRQRTAHDGSRQAAQGGAHPGRGTDRRHGGQGGQGGQGSQQGERGERSAAPQGRQPRQGQHQAQQGQQQGRQPAREPVDPVVHAIGKLQKRFPAAFPKKPEPKLPLKVGIFEDLLPHAEQLGLSEAEIREAIATWCRGSRYWTCLTDGAARVDLNGAPAGVVNARDVAFARNSQRGGPRRPRAEGAAGAGGAAATAKGEAAEGAGAEGSEVEAHSNAAPAVDAPVLAQPDEASGVAVEAQVPGAATAAATAPEQLQNHAATGVEGSVSAEAGASAEASVSAEVGASAEASAEAEATSAEPTAEAASTNAAEAPNPAAPAAAAPAASEKAHANS